MIKVPGFSLSGKAKALIALFAISLLFFTFLSTFASADTPTGTDLAPSAKVSFTFDDSLQSTYINAEPTLAKYGLKGTDYAITGCVGMTKVPNKCNANQDTPYMTWAQLQALQNTDGWEIGSHTVDHDCLASSAVTDSSDCANLLPLTTAQIDAELANSKSALSSNGINATDFAPPYGDFNNNVMAQIAKYYASMRQFKNASNYLNTWPESDYYIQNTVALERTDPVSTIEADINTAIANKQWIVLTFHDIETNPSKNPDDYQYGTAELAQIAAYVQAKQAAGQIQSVTVNQGLVTSATNLLPNSSFSDGIADGWTTDSPSNVTLDTASNGSYPNPKDSIKFVSSGSKSIHLYSPKVSVNTNTTYILKNFLNVSTISSGELGFYIDEYNSSGQWISGQWLKKENSSFVEDMNFTYKPSSAAVSTAALQIYVTPNAGITAYIANPQMFPSAINNTPPTNLMPNSTFDGGLTSGWTTDAPSFITADGGNNGAPTDPINSIFLSNGSTSSNAHLFSPKISVSSTKSYAITNWLNLKQLTNTSTGEVGFYIDEYNSSGQWISGQYKIGKNTIGATSIGFNYTPSSSNVAQASLQVIVTSNSGVQAYLDDASWTQN